MKPKLHLLVFIFGLSVGFVACNSPASRPILSASQANMLQHVDTGTVTGVRLVTIEGRKTNLGLVAGAVAGGAVGNAAGLAATNGRPGVGSAVVRVVSSGVGTAAGAVGGQAIEEIMTRKNDQEISIRMDDGSSVVVAQEADSGVFQDGDRVHILNGGGEARVTLEIPTRDLAER